MRYTFFIIRVIFFLLCITGAWLLWYVADYKEPEASRQLLFYLFVGSSIGMLTILVDVFLKGFSLRGLTALTFGLGMGALVAYLISSSPLLDKGDPEILFLVRLVLFIVMTYLGAVIALRGRDDFNLVIPYIKFVPQKVEASVVVVDTSALIDGRVHGICKTGFLTVELVIPRFVIDDLQRVADSPDPMRKARGRKGLQVLNELRKLPDLNLTIHESELEKREQIDAKLIFIAQSLKARLLTLDFNLAKLAEFQGVGWLNISELARVLNPEVVVGEKFDIELVRQGKDMGQAVGYLPDGSMVVVNDAESMIGQVAHVEVVSIIPSAAGRMIFAKLIK
jgi:uncharacterized protein YacL